jgi:ribosomal protein S18 acetylase RimI-like enzyme
MIDYKELVRFYRAYNLVPSGLSDDELTAYFIAMEHRKNLIVELDFEFAIIGFIELWRINYEQLGRIMVHGLIDAREEDTSSGPICFLANLAIHPDYRSDKHLDRILRNRFFKENYQCEYFCGDSRRRIHHHTFNIYKRTDIMNKYLTEVQHG